MIYELRTYWTNEGKLEDLNNRFRNVTIPIFERLGMKVVAFWTPETPTEETGNLIYILGFESVEAMADAWSKFRVDPAWIEGKAASEVNGVLVRKVTSVVMNPTDYSAMQ
ncbi:MAG: NIPSNAP family protein [Anaerolineaceae bacterium]|nr:NIPSNAP family protein [Anaerolineaceae bacterium]